ncbi:hypothetical protein H5410_032575 [Solanum commersonii]|uniref:Uncharacterized protein n=1 Tax=Solanum commersonii TaxID=4109 RepID=A0A9J5YMM0_SOLCO|nr:hypothetical protein H5410_032575 [Solanum commersonii]
MEQLSNYIVLRSSVQSHPDLSSGNVRGTGTLEIDLYVIHVNTQLKTQGTQLRSQQDQATSANVLSSTSPNNLFPLNMTHMHKVIQESYRQTSR